MIQENTSDIKHYFINALDKEDFVMDRSGQKTIELIEHYEKLKNLETQNKEDKISQKKEVKKIKKNYKKKKYYKKTK